MRLDGCCSSVTPVTTTAGRFSGALSRWAKSPAKAAIREAREEIGAEVRLIRLLDVLGGPDYRVTYPNGDLAAYVTAVYEAQIVDGLPRVADQDELSDMAWFSPGQLPRLELSRLSRALLQAIGHL
jgi:ADP-ribose pyrophosphatase YjhB (NUDIX family)